MGHAPHLHFVLFASGAALIQGAELDQFMDGIMVVDLPEQLDSVWKDTENFCWAWTIRTIGPAGAAASVTPLPPRTARRDAPSATL